MNEIELTSEMLQEELREYAAGIEKKKSRWTPEHDALLVTARDELNLTWPQLAAFWKKKFGWGSDKALNARYKEVKANDEVD